ncbi:DUF1330 domain-containing protein [Microbulbifer sp. VTAC004]|uniref:DUF1330 domain-containing protein n=1 Tax=Microbulbifer sp. VTAC004 TaxID=3243386 RepID=UPI004039C2AD
MIYLFMHAEVEDFNRWQEILTDFKPILNQMGATKTSIYQEIGNLNNITVIHEFPSKEKAEAFVNSSELHKARKKAGVIGAPRVWFTEKL